MLCKRAARFGVSPTMPAPEMPGPNQVANDDQTRCDTDTRLQGRVGLQGTYSRDQFQPSAHGSLCVVLVGLGIPKVDQDPVAHVLRDEAAEALHGLRDALLIGRNYFTKISGSMRAESAVEPTRSEK